MVAEGDRCLDLETSNGNQYLGRPCLGEKAISCGCSKTRREKVWPSTNTNRLDRREAEVTSQQTVCTLRSEEWSGRPMRDRLTAKG